MTVDEVDGLLAQFTTEGGHRGDIFRSILAAWKPLLYPRKDAEVLVAIFGAEEGQEPATMFRERHGNFAFIVLGALEHWTTLLRPHFEDPQIQTPSTTTFVRQQLADVPPIEAVALWDNGMTWRDRPFVIRALTGLLGALPAKEISKFEHASKLVPFVVHLAEDCTPANRIRGVEVMKYFMHAVVSRITLQMQLDELFFSILLKNLTFADVVLKRESITLLNTLLLPMLFVQKRERALECSDRLLELLVKEASFAQDVQLRSFYLDAMLPVARSLSVSLVCHLTILLPLVVDALDDRRVCPDRSILELIQVILDTCWPRLQAHSALLSVIHQRLSVIDLEDPGLIERIKSFCL